MQCAGLTFPPSLRDKAGVRIGSQMTVTDASLTKAQPENPRGCTAFITARPGVEARRAWRRVENTHHFLYYYLNTGQGMVLIASLFGGFVLLSTRRKG